jgi:hypothetical protein
MKRFLPVLAVLLASCSGQPVAAPPARLATAAPAPASSPSGLPVYDHVVIVVEENKDYEQIVGSPAAPYINKLKAEGANLTRMFAEEHHSEGNYFWLLSGSNQGVGFIDRIPPQPITAKNLGAQLIHAGRSFKGYSEDLPAIGSAVGGSGLYARKHVPWVSFSNLPNGTTAATSSNLRFRDFPADYRDLPTVSFVIPNLIDDMHDGKVPASVRAGDRWLEENLQDYYQWARKNNSLLIVTFDENDHGPAGLTDPVAAKPSQRNRIATIFAGARIQPGDYPEGKGVTHVNLLRTLESMYGLAKAGKQQRLASKAGISDNFLITDVFAPAP